MKNRLLILAFAAVALLDNRAMADNAGFAALAGAVVGAAAMSAYDNQYEAPPPVVYAPPPAPVVYAAPAPVYSAPVVVDQPVYGYGYRYRDERWRGGWHDWHGRGRCWRCFDDD